MNYWSSVSLFVLPLVIHAGESIKPALEAQPAVLEKLKNLKSNQAVLLGPAKVMGEFNDTARKYNLHKTGPLARDFTLKMVWAPERKRALYCGANHGVPHPYPRGELLRHDLYRYFIERRVRFPLA